jgi:maleate isomerase
VLNPGDECNIIIDNLKMKSYKLGIVVPSTNTTMETEFWRMVSGWGTVHTARIRLEDITINSLERMEEQTIEAALRLSDADVDVIGYGCTSGSLFRGRDHHIEIEEKIQKETGTPSVATAGAVLDALEWLDLIKISVATPYTNEINVLIRSFLEQHHRAVLVIKGLNIVDNREVSLFEPEMAYDLAKEIHRLGKEVHKQDAEGLFISCTNFRTIEILGQLEEELGVPVISSNTATIWAMMRKLGIEKRLEGLGSLFL